MIAALLSLSMASLGPTLRVEGEGYFRLVHNGRIVYAREVRVESRAGKLTDPNGAEFLPSVLVADVQRLTIAPDGTLTLGTAKLGRLTLGVFESEKLVFKGNYWIASSRARVSFPGENGAGRVIVSAGNREVPEAKPKPNATPLNARSSLPTQDLPSVSVRAESTILGEKILLGEVAEIDAPESVRAQLAGIDLGPAPVVGVPKAIRRERILGALRQGGMKPEQLRLTVPTGAIAVRRGQSLSGEQVLQAAESAVKAKLGPTVTLKPRQELSSTAIPQGALELRPEQVSANLQSATVLIGVYVDGKRINGRMVLLDVSGGTEGVRAGTPIRIRIRSGLASVDVPGKARTTAFVGQTTEVLAETGTTHQGVVIAPGLVEVKL